MPIPPQQPMIVKYVQPHRSGIQSHNLSRQAIGYVLRGRKDIYYGDVRHEVVRGDLFYLGSGHHYTENIPETNKPFEQIVFYYTPEQLARILAYLSLSYRLDIANDHACKNCSTLSHVVYPAWGAIRNFFTSSDKYIREEIFSADETAENIKLTELVYLILSNPDCCIKSKMLGSVDILSENFEQVIHNHIFCNISVEELASKCNRSLTAFKKEFKRHFDEPPHKWFIRQRLMHARLLLISTGKSISEVGIECNFPNTSHFIKLFRKEYGATPAQYRACSHKSRGSATPVLRPATHGHTVPGPSAEGCRI